MDTNFHSFHLHPVGVYLQSRVNFFALELEFVHAAKTLRLVTLSI